MNTRQVDDLLHDLHVHQVELETQNRELREAQERLEETSERYSELYDFAPVGYCTLDLEGRIQQLNLPAATLCGAPRELLLGRPFSVVAPLENASLFHAHLRRCAFERGRVTSELGFKTGTHESRTVQLISDPVRSASGVTTGYRTILVDISELKLLEDRLRLMSAAGERLTSRLGFAGALDEAAKIAVPKLADICIVDVKSKAGVVERKVVLFADPQKQASLADRVMKVAPPPGWQRPQALVIATGEPLILAETVEQPEWPADGFDHDLLRQAGVRSLMVLPLIARGETLGALTLASAESERRYSPLDFQVAQDFSTRIAMALDNTRLYDEALQARQIAERAILARDNVLGVVAHDLRNPLSGIMLQASLLKRRSPQIERRSQRPTEVILRAARRMTRLIQDLLDVTSIDAGHLSLEAERVDVAKTVSELVEAQSPLATAKSIELRAELRPALAEITADRERLMQVLENLVTNAIKSTPSGGTIIVGAAPAAAEVLFSVADTGAGISADDLPHLFDRFWQAPEQKKHGVGLGLPIVKGIVEAHGGQIWVESSLGAGTTFFFMLPREPRLASTGKRPAPDDVHGSTVRLNVAVERCPAPSTT